MRIIPMRPLGLLALTLLTIPPATHCKEPNAAPRAVALPVPGALTITPAECTIGGADQVQRLLVLGLAKDKKDGRQFDYSRKAVYSTSDDKVATITADGVVKPVGN